jgi:ribonuclease HI
MAKSRYIGLRTNNQAEYEALIMALEAALSLGAEVVTCYLDSELVTKQLRGEYAVKNPELRRLWSKTCTLRKQFKNATFINVPRTNSQIQKADRLVNESLDKEGNDAQALNLRFNAICSRGVFVPEMIFEGAANWKSGMECDLTVKGKQIATVSPPPAFGGKEGYCVPEEIFAASLASCMNTLFLLIARNSKLELKKLETKAAVTMNVEGLEKLIFTHIHFSMNIKLQTDDAHERTKADSVYHVAQRICPLTQSWGDKVPVSFELNFQ